MGMPDIYDEIFEYANNYIKSNSTYSPEVVEEAPEQAKVFPLIIIREIDNPFYGENLDKSNQMFRIEYEIEIYTTNREITNELKILVNNVFDIHYGMNRRACNPIKNADRDIDRLYMRYNALIDENKKIYRR